MEVEDLDVDGQVTMNYVTPFTLEDGIKCDFQAKLDNIACVYADLGSGLVEVHEMLRTSYGYGRTTVHPPSVIGFEDAPNFNWGFRGEDLVAIKRNNPQSGFVEMHILSKDTGFARFIVQVATPLSAEDGANFRFQMVGDDLVALKVRNAQSNSTEIHVLSGASTYSVFTLHSDSGIPQASSSEELVIMPNRDLLVITGHTRDGAQISNRLKPSNGYRPEEFL